MNEVKSYVSSSKVDHIARTAAKLFSSKGFLSTSMNDVAAAARMSKGAVYHYFHSKNEILYFITSNYVGIDIDNLENELRAIDDNRERIHYIIKRHIKHYTTHIYEAKTMLHETYNLPPKYLRQIRSQERKYYEIVSGVLLDYMGKQTEEHNPKALALTLFGMCNWIYSWYNPKGAINPDELSELIFNVFTVGIDGLL